MSKEIPGQRKLGGVNAPKVRGRVRAAAGKEIANARARGVDVSPLTVTALYYLADQLDRIERSGDDVYLTGQLFTRLLEERRAGNTLPVTVNGEAEDVWSALSRELAGMEERP